MEQFNAVGVCAETFVLAPGASLVVTPLAGQLDAKINFIVGGSMALLSAFPIYAYGNSGGGATMATGTTVAGSIPTGISGLMPLPPTTVFEIRDFSGPLALVAYGATATCALFRRYRPSIQTSYPG